jgi:predicted ATPase
MLTRIEIDGFKTFREFAVDLVPFQVIVGPNAVGKSNLFDALRLLSRLAETDLYGAFQNLRGEASDMFSLTSPGTRMDTMSFATEVLLDHRARDPWGVEVEAKHTRIRYELTLTRKSSGSSVERLFVTRENAKPILEKDDTWAKERTNKRFRDAYVLRGRQVPWLETTDKDGSPSFQIKQDARAGRARPADAAESTVLSGVTNAEFPHLFALREELRSWRFLQLNPEALRTSCSTLAASRLAHDGSNLAAVLARIKNEANTGSSGAGILADVSVAMSQLVPGVRTVDVIEDEKRREYRIEIVMQDGNAFPSRLLSDGTLRILALVVLMHDPSERGLICFEEPENGVHPFRLGQMIEMLRMLSAQLRDDDGLLDEPLKQVIVNSHSPIVLKHLEPEQTLFADIVTQVAPPPESSIARCTRLRRVQSQLFEDDDESVTTDHVRRLLETATPHAEFAQ